MNAYSDVSPIIAVFYETEPFDIMLLTTNSRAIIISTALIPQKTTRDSQGAALITLRSGAAVSAASRTLDRYGPPKRYKKTKIPASPTTLDDGQMSLEVSE